MTRRPTATKAPTTSSWSLRPTPTSARTETFRSAYRFTGTSVVVLDQRELPGAVDHVRVPRSANDVASALRSGAVTPGPVMGQVAAYGMALAAVERRRSRRPDSRDQVIAQRRGRASRRAAARSTPCAQAVERMMARYDELANARRRRRRDRERDWSPRQTRSPREATAACAEIGRRWSELVVGDPKSTCSCTATAVRWRAAWSAWRRRASSRLIDGGAHGPRLGDRRLRRAARARASPRSS